MRTTAAKFEIGHTQYLDPNGKPTGPLPDWAKDTATLVHMYKWMVQVRVFDTKAIALQRTWEATPEPKLVVAVGDCGCHGGIFGESYASLGRVANVIPVDVEVPGCPPTPTALLQGILAAIGGSAKKGEQAQL